MSHVCAIYFSPTGTTEKVVTAIAHRIGETLRIPVDTFNFTPKAARESLKTFTTNHIAVFGMPVIAGRLPNLLLNYLDTIQGNGALAIPVVLFGNRAYDDALMELREIMSRNGFRTIAAAAFVGEHSFSNILAQGRPDEKDMAIARDFADQVAGKIISGADLTEPVSINGQLPLRPYYQPRDRAGNPIDIRKVKPHTDRSLCLDCKICAESCPLGAINHDHVEKITDPCMKCCACIKKCPVGAKYFDDPNFLYHKLELEQRYTGRSEPELFL
ncbi:EFR1 family ferrodoxin [Bacteroidales bacterium OttesenSCG-928-B11]|nr:EFR1 family ferrodoxin [Bacteroidales bacterium OttesenSCG-928-E04]MDL2308160.1 EFR1 family ferrodoxin [Bacteroidales bacterium OttesenSCG-928-C03]MDL2311485.1 EFR1 family ferrodoxin [Bacteroidales bacterium OttesenSCG-928-B11]MDL2325586.1 EFR1 family ferrodoxin [Bacteroidales bacterium OttesenSCG-928-A14]